jgi:SPP1 family predicted phage head-tail adaptor
MFRHRVTFQAPDEQQDTASGAVETISWLSVFENVPAAVEQRSVRENVGGAQMQVTTAITVTVRWRPGLNAKQRIVWQTADGERVFNISGLVPDKYTNNSVVEIPVVELV